MAGFGSGGWGSVPWGGSALEFENPPDDFDIFCFFNAPSSMGLILSDPDVTTVADPGQLTIDGANDLVVLSGNGVSTDTTVLLVSSIVPADRTLEFTLLIDDLPLDFSDLVTNHLFVGTTSTASSCAGLFFSMAGIGYVGGVHYAPNLILDSTFQLIPGSNAYVTPGVYVVVRLAINETTGSVYLYVTKQSDLSFTGHVLRAILPVIDAGTLAYPPINATYVSARGTVLSPTQFRLDELCMSSDVLVANLAPIADAGLDRSIELCSIIQLDGSASFDPEGAALLYRWRLIEAPLTSIYSVAGADGRTYPIDLSGFTTKFHSPYLSTLLDPIEIGDVLLIGSDVRTVTTIGVDGNGYFLGFTAQNIPDNLGPNVQFKVLRQRGIYNDDQVVATFLPDVVGFYRFDLIVSDGSLPSAPSVIVVNVLEAVLPRGVVPDVSFIFGLMSDFWGLVEDTERVSTLWSGVAQVAAGELLSLWQHDYAKSLRDIQRQFTRKWLHYDLLLPEPIPELTKVRFMPVAIESGFFSAAQYVSYPASISTVTIVAAIRSEPIVVSVPAGTVATTAATLALSIEQVLRRIDRRFSVEVVTASISATFSIRIAAPFAFEVTETTLPQISGQDLFVVGTKAQQPHGTVGIDASDDQIKGVGVGIGTSTYRVARPIGQFGIDENDFLVLDGVAYRIDRLLSVVADTTDIILKEALPSSPVKTWSIVSYVTSELLDFWNGLVTIGDVATFEIAESNAAAPSSALRYELFVATVAGLNQSLPSHLPVDLSDLPVDAVDTANSVLLARVLRRQYVPIAASVLDVPTLSASIVVDTVAKEEAVLRRNVDYFIESVRSGRAIRFVVGTPDVWEQQDPPDRLWAEFTYLDNRPVIEQNFGIPVEFTLDKLAALDVELDYLSAVRGLWYAYFNGPTLYNLRIGAQILLGLPFAEEAGIIIEIRTDFSPTLGRILIRDTANSALVRSYTFPKVLDLETNRTTGAVYVVGDTVTQFAPLVTGAAVTDYIKDPRWFQGLLNQQYMREVEKYFRFLVTVDSAVFNLSAFLAVREFILKIKPTYTYPLISVQSGNERDDEITVDDVMVAKVSLKLFESVCAGMFGNATMFDQYNGSGGIFNQFDTNADPFDAPPTFPTSDTPVLWAFDKNWLCPEDVVVGIVSTRFAAPAAIMVGQCFVVGEPADVLYGFEYVGVSLVVPLGPGSVAIPPDPVDPTNTVNTAGTLTGASIRSFGPMGGLAGNLELVIEINSIEVASIPFTFTDPNGSAKVTMSLAVSITDAVTVALRATSAPSAGAYPWAQLQIRVFQDDAVDPWFVGMVLPAGTYATTRIMT